MFPIEIIKLKNETKLKQNSIKVSHFFSGRFILIYDLKMEINGAKKFILI